MRYQCASCGRRRSTYEGPLLPTLDSNFVLGKCSACKGSRVHRIVDDERFDLDEGRRRKAEGQQRAVNGRSQRDAWGDRFDAAVRALAITRETFTSEDVTALVGLPTSGSASAVGARMTAAAKRSVIVKTGRHVSARRPNQHAAELTEWRGA